MFKVLEIIKQIENTSGRNDKEAILLANKDNQLLRDVLYFVYNTYIITGLSDKKIKKKVAPIREFKQINDIMEYLKENNTGSDRDIQHVQNYITNQPEELQELYTQIATKNLKIGITANTINKIFGKSFIPQFSVMLASKYEDHEHKVDKFIATEKKDGVRCVMVKDAGKVEFFTRQGKTIDGLIEIITESEFLPHMVYDGELVLRNGNNLNSADLFRETMKVVRKDGIKKNVEFHVFDALPFAEFQEGKSTKGAKERKEDLHHILDSSTLSFIKEVPVLYVGNDKDQIQFLLEKMENEGKEGIMINDVLGKYECKRSTKLLKVKSMQTVDLEIIGFEEGTNKYEGKLGRINVDYKGNSIGVGSGFSDMQRIEIWNNQIKYLGRVCEIQFFEESSNQNDDKISLRFPIFKGIREMGKEVSYY